MNQFDILKNKGFNEYIKYIDSKKEDLKNTLSKREYYKWLNEAKDNLKDIPYTTEVIHHYDINNIPEDVKKSISYASDIGVLAILYQEDIITEEMYKNIRKRIQNNYQVTSDIVI